MNKNFKATFFEENAKTYMKLEFEIHVGLEKQKVTIHKIDMNEFNINRTQIGPYYYNLFNNDIKFYLASNENNEIYRIQDITERKEMTMTDIEKALGYKVKIVNKN